MSLQCQWSFQLCQYGPISDIARGATSKQHIAVAMSKAVPLSLRWANVKHLWGAASVSGAQSNCLDCLTCFGFSCVSSSSSCSSSGRSCCCRRSSNSRTLSSIFKSNSFCQLFPGRIMDTNNLACQVSFSAAFFGIFDAIKKVHITWMNVSRCQDVLVSSSAAGSTYMPRLPRL